jgi:acetyl esterase/lipase
MALLAVACPGVALFLLMFAMRGDGIGNPVLAQAAAPVEGADAVEAAPAAKPLATIEVRENVQYGTGAGEPLTLHLYKPVGDGPFPCVVYIHGGAWAAGKKDDVAQFARDAAHLGYVTATIGYRLCPRHLFPAAVEDVKCAVRYLRAHAREHKIRADRIGALGISAGAHLAMMLGTMDKEDGLEGEGGWADQSSKVQAVVAYFGPTDLLGTIPDVSVPLVERFIGGGRKTHEAEWKRASPITYVSSGDAPTLIFQGTNDALVPPEQAWVMAGAMGKARVAGRVEILVGANHGWGGDELKRTIAAGNEFFHEHLVKVK